MHANACMSSYMYIYVSLYTSSACMHTCTHVMHARYVVCNLWSYLMYIVWMLMECKMMQWMGWGLYAIFMGFYNVHGADGLWHVMWCNVNPNANCRMQPHHQHQGHMEGRLWQCCSMETWWPSMSVASMEHRIRSSITRAGITSRTAASRAPSISSSAMPNPSTGYVPKNHYLPPSAFVTDISILVLRSIPSLH